MSLVNRYIGAPVKRVEDLRFVRGCTNTRPTSRALRCCMRPSCAAQSHIAAFAQSTQSRRWRSVVSMQ